MPLLGNTKRWRIWLSAGLLLLVLVGVSTLWFGTASMDTPPEATEEGRLATSARPPSETLTPAERFVRARGGDRRVQRELCSPHAWARLESLISEVGEDEVVVDPERWGTGTVQTRVGMASWISQCLFEGRPLSVRSRSGELLANYDSLTGFRAAN